MVKVLQDERDAFLATRAGSCGGFPLPDNFSELSTLVEVKTRELTRLSSVLTTIGHKTNVKRRAVSNGPITSMGQPGSVEQVLCTVVELTGSMVV